VVVLICK